MVGSVLTPLDATADACARLDRHGRTPFARIARLPNHHYFLAPDGESVVPFVISGSAAMVPGEPCGPSSGHTQVIQQFVAHCRRRHLRPAFLPLAPSGAADPYRDAGLSRIRIGSEALLSLPDFSLDGGARKTVRQSASRLSRLGYTFSLLTPPHTAALLHELHSVSAAWLRGKGLPERRIGCGWFDDAYLARFRVACIRNVHGAIVAFANLIDDYHPAEGTLDLIRQAPTAPSGAMDALFAEVARTYQREGRLRFSLGLSPLVGLRDQDLSTLALRWMGRKGSNYYDAEGLAGFKSKFKPSWEPREIAVARRDVPAVVFALCEGHAAGLMRRAVEARLDRVARTVVCALVPPRPAPKTPVNRPT